MIHLGVEYHLAWPQGLSSRSGGLVARVHGVPRILQLGHLGTAVMNCWLFPRTGGSVVH